MPDKTLRLYKSSTLGRRSKFSGQEPSRSSEEDAALAATRYESWEDESIIRQGELNVLESTLIKIILPNLSQIIVTSRSTGYES